MTVLERTIEALKQLGGKGTYSEIYSEYEILYGKPITYGQKAGIRKIIEDHSSDSHNFKGKEDIFYSVDGIGNGVWGLR
jgi:putative restriction endonuclease